MTLKDLQNKFHDFIHHVTNSGIAGANAVVSQITPAIIAIAKDAVAAQAQTTAEGREKFNAVVDAILASGATQFIHIAATAAAAAYEEYKDENAN